MVTEENKSHNELVLYVGAKMSAMIPGVKNGLFLRGVPKAVTGATAALVESLFPEFQVLNRDCYYIGSSCTVDNFETIAANLPEAADVLFMRDMGLGDVLLSLPTVAAVRRRLPHAHLTYATLPPYIPIVESVGLVDSVINLADVDLTTTHYQFKINWIRCLENYDLPRNCGRRVDSFAKMIGLPRPDPNVIPPVISEADEKYMQGFLYHTPGPYIGYILKAAAWNRSHPIYKAREVFEEIHKRLPAHKILVFDNQEDFGLFDDMKYVVPLNGKTTIMQAAATLKMCDMVVSPDTGFAHLAASLDVPTLVLLSSQPFDWRYDHYGEHVDYIHKIGAAECVPCYDWARKKCKAKFCNETHENICLQSIRPMEIANRAAMMVAKNKARGAA